ncbi:MAG TPA: hypothetical protein VLX68_10065 [Chitinivibrionales bacterium]|nr:hypothetical protein [Chitinivibrionales bacterium]
MTYAKRQAGLEAALERGAARARRSSAIGPWQPEPKADDPCDPWKSLTREKHPKGWTGRRAAAAKLRNAMIIRIYFF